MRNRRTGNIILIIIIMLLFSNLTGCKQEVSEKVTEEQVDTNNKKLDIESQLDIKLSEITKIRVISIWSDKESEKYIKKEKAVIENEDILNSIGKILKYAEINRNLAMDRLPSEYELELHFKDNKVVNMFYWIKEDKYNLEIRGITGVITIDGYKMDDILMNETKEKDRPKLEDPYL